MKKRLALLMASLFLIVGTVWAEAPQVGQRYRLKNAMTGLYMQVNGSNNLQLQEQKYSVLQFFRLEDAGDGKFYLKSESGVNKYVNASGWNAVTSDGANTPFTIALVEGETDLYTLHQVASVGNEGKIGADANTAGASLYCNKVVGNNGKWQFEPVANPEVCTFDGTKTYRIRSQYSGLYMQVTSYTTSGATEGAFRLKDKNILAEGQKFKFEAATDGKFYLKTLKGETTYYVNMGTWNFHAGTDPTTPFTIEQIEGFPGVYSIHQAVGGNTDHHGYAGNVNTNLTDGAKIYCNQPSLNGNTVWSFEEVPAVDPNNITELTQFDNNSYYKVYGERGMIYGADGVVKGTNVRPQGYSEGNLNQHFAIISKNDKYYLYNVGAKKFVVKSGNVTKLVDLPEQPITLEKTSDANYVWSIKLNGTHKMNLSDSGTDGVYTNYETEDGGNRWLIYKIGTFDNTEALAAFDKAYVTVNYVHNGKTITKTEVVAQGSTFTLKNPSTYTTVTSCTAGGNSLTEDAGVYSITVPNEGTTITMNLEGQLPFTVSESHANAVWQFMRIRPVRNSTEEFNWVTKCNAEPYTFSDTRPTTDAGLWAFVGNVVDGFKIYNKDADANSTLGVNGSNIVVKEGEKTWTVGKCIEGSNLRGFYLYEGTDNKYAHELDGKLQIWNSSSAPTDGGSAFVACNPLIVNYVGADGLDDLDIEALVEGGVYTLANRSEHTNNFLFIKSVTVNENEVEAVNGVWPITLNGVTEVEVTLGVPELTNKPTYALKSPTGTYLGMVGEATGLVANGVYTITGDANGTRGFLVAGQGYEGRPVLSDITYSGCTNNSVTAIPNGKNWYVYTNVAGTYIYNVGIGKFLANEWGNINFSDVPYAWSIVQNGNYTSIYDNTISKYLSMACGTSPTNENERIIRWDTNQNDGGAQHTFATVAGDYTTQIAAAQAAIDLIAVSFQETPLYLTYAPAANRGAIFQYKDDDTKYIGYTADGWNVTTNESTWTILEADLAGYSQIVRSDDDTKYLGSDANTNVGTSLYSNVGNSCNKWTFEGAYEDYKTNATEANSKYHFQSDLLFYAGACNKLRFTLTESDAKYENGKNRMSFDSFELYDINGNKVELTEACFTGNYSKSYASMLDGANGTYCNGEWKSTDDGNDWFEIILPNNVDLGGAFSFSFVTENTTMNAKAFRIDMRCEKNYYRLNINAPYGYEYEATYGGDAVVNGHTFEGDFDDTQFTISDIEGYTYTVEVDDENYIVNVVYTQAAAIVNPKAVVDLINRIGGTGTADSFKFVLDNELEGESFVIGAEEGKILIKGSTISAITTGIGWYLNNIAHINIAWNSLNEKTTTVKWDPYAGYADLSNLPLPVGEETHTSDAKYRYYLNTCTFGYSMTSWTWTRWQQEIDWMALHGINMPLQLIGMEEVWRKFLINQGYSETEAKAFVAGPAFIAWWAMNNLQGWGGTAAGSKSGHNNLPGAGGVQDDAWYVRQVNLAKQILDAQRSLGMQPVLPGWSGMVPTNFAEKSTGKYATRSNGGNWAGDFVRPLLLNVNIGANKYAAIAADYYACLKEVMGESQYYSMDPFHEGGGAGTMEDYEALYAAMESAKPGSQWVIQQWQWSATQKYSLTAVPAGKLVVLDLFSDGSPAFDDYSGYAPQEAVFCAIPNFGGRSGLMGRLQNVTDNYFKFKGQYESIKGIGTAPEAIEQTPVTYDLIYQLPWMNGQKPNVAEWVDNYAVARYGKDNAVVKEAWSLLRQGPLNYGADGIQGPVEDVWAARPNLDANKASSWGKTLANAGNVYTPARRQMLIDAVYKLIDQEDELELADGSVYKSNYLYDLVEFGGGVMADYAFDLLLGIKAAKNAAGANFADDDTYKARRDAFLQLILDMDAFRGTNLNFRLGKWTQEARDAATEVEGATTATPDWYEYNNARTILSTWSSPATNLTDYSYRSWQGLLKDYYYKRWKYYFDNNCNGGQYEYFEWNWAHGKVHYVGQTGFSNEDLTEEQDGYTSKYTREPVGNTVEEAKSMFAKYIIPVAMADGTHYAYRYLTNDLSNKVTIIAAAGSTIDLTQYFGALEGATVSGNFMDGTATGLQNIPLKSNLADGAYTGTITLEDGTALTFGVSVNPKYNGTYKIKYSGDPVFIQYHNVGDNAGNVGYKVVTTKKADGSPTGYSADYEADQLFTITPSGAGFALSAQGQYLKTTVSSGWNHIMFSEQKGDAGTYLINEADNLVKFKSTNASDKASVAIYDNGAWGNDEDGKAISFSLEQVTTYAITIPESGYYGICLPFNVVLPTGVTAYDVTVENLTCGDEGAITSLDSIATEGQILKAGTPALLKGTAGDYNLTITMDNTDAKTSSVDSKLRGNFVKQTLAPGILNKFIYTSEGEHPFVRINGEQEIPANTCWIEANIDADNVEVTEYQGKVLKIDDWLFTYEVSNNGSITLLDAAVPGDGELVIGSYYTVNGQTQRVSAISPTFLHGNTNLTSITLPATMTNLGFRIVEPMFEGSYEGKPGDYGVFDKSTLIEGQGYNREFVFPNDPLTGEPYKVSGDFAWRLTLDVTVDNPESSFNNYGSALVSTKANSLDDNYKGYMQIYLQKGNKNIVVKIDNNDDRYLYNTKVLDAEGNETAEDLANTNFKFELEYDGAGGYQVVIYYQNGKAKMYNISASQQAVLEPFNKLTYSLPEGMHVKVKFEKLISQGLFVGCTNLETIKVHEDNPTFKSCEHGVLYDKNGYYVMRIPEGGTDHFDIPSKVVKLYAGAVHGVNADIVLHSNPQIGVVKGHEHDVENARFYLSLDDKDNTITENETGYGGARDFTSANNNTYLAARYKRTPLKNAQVFGTICLPFVPENATAKYDFFKFKSGNGSSLTFTQVDQLEANEPYIYRMKATPEEASELSGDEVFGTDESRNDIFETNTSFTVETKAKYDPTLHQPGTCEALGSFVNYFVETAKHTKSNFYLYKSDTNKFHRVTNKLTYRPYRAFFVVTPDGQAAQAPSRLNLELLDGTTTSIDASLVEGMEAPEYYDLSGRRVLNPVSGGIYIVNGQKVVLK